MDLNKISSFIRLKRKELGLTQDELAKKLSVTEKAVSRWETGRGTPDISLLIPLSKELNIDVSELLCGEENKNDKNSIVSLIEYNEKSNENKFNFSFKLTVFFYIISVLTFLLYLRFEYNPIIEINYFIRLFFVIIASIFIFFGNKIYCNNHVEKIDDKNKFMKISYVIIFLYYVVLLFNVIIFARYNYFDSYNLIPFKSIITVLKEGTTYDITINILGNLLIFMPLEYFLITLFKLKKIPNHFLISFVIIGLIELFQYIFKVGVFDVDDLILGFCGMIIFYIIYKKWLDVWDNYTFLKY